jgi:type I restriction enzyme S subunit
MNYTSAMQTKTNGRSLPKGWQWVKLGDVCKPDRQIVEPKSSLASRLLYLSLEHIESNSGRILREPTEPIQDEGRSTSFYFDHRHVLYGKLRPYLNKVVLPDFEGRCTTELIPILPTDIDREFLAWVLRRQETVDVAMQEKTGSRMPRANMDNLLALEIPLPPLDEQRRIASRLNEQLAAVESARKAAEEQLGAAWELPSAYSREVFESIENSLPKSWRWATLADVCQFKRGPFGGSLKKDIFVGSGYKVYEQQHAIQDNFEIGRYYITEDKYKEMEVFAIKPNDLIVSCSGTMGRIAIVPPNAEPGIINQALLKLTPKFDLVSSSYLKAYLQSENVQKKYFLVSSGTAIQNVAPVSELKQIRVPLPTLPEQEALVNALQDKIQSSKLIVEMLESQLAKINRLPASLLREAFAGQG